MTNEMKLLRAFIEAQGYEIKETATAKSIAEREEYIALGCAFDPKLEYDYKVTKKVDDVFIEVNDDGHSQILSKPRELDYCTHPTQFKVSIVNGAIEISKVGKLDEWEVVSENI